MGRAVCGKRFPQKRERKENERDPARIQLHGFISDYNLFKRNLISLCSSLSVSHPDCSFFMRSSRVMASFYPRLRVNHDGIKGELNFEQSRNNWIILSNYRVYFLIVKLLTIGSICKLFIINYNGNNSFSFSIRSWQLDNFDL